MMSIAKRDSILGSSARLGAIAIAGNAHARTPRTEMSDEVTVTVSINLKPDIADNFCDVMLPGLQKQTRAFEGVMSARAVRKSEQPTKVLLIDVFASQQQADAYFAWRSSTGDLDLLASLVIEPPAIDFWPRLAGSQA